MKRISQRTGQRWITRIPQQVLVTAGLLFLVGCGTSDAPPSPELLENIQNAISSPSPEILRNSKDIPRGAWVVISDPSDGLRFQMAEETAIYKGGRGAVVLEGKKVFLYHLTVTDQQLTRKE